MLKLVFKNRREEEAFVVSIWNIVNNYEESLLKYFFEEELRNLKKSFKTNYFRYKGDNHEKETIGLYGELVVLYLLLNKFGRDVYAWWRKGRFDKFDFSVGNRKKIEVKASLRNGRNHRFSHQQLYSLTENILIASCLLIKDKKGKSLYEVYLEIRKKVKDDYKILQDLDGKIYELGVYSGRQGPSFNFVLALSTLKFYDVKVIPKYEQKEPLRVTDTNYCIFLEVLPEEKIEEWLSRV